MDYFDFVNPTPSKNMLTLEDQHHFHLHEGHKKIKSLSRGSELFRILKNNHGFKNIKTKAVYFDTNMIKNGKNYIIKNKNNNKNNNILKKKKGFKSILPLIHPYNYITSVKKIMFQNNYIMML
jgi:hypothetical protein